MKRRTVLIGLGSAAAGSALVFGSGAFTQVSADRSVTIGIDEDSDALLALVANDDLESVFQNDDGELEIDSEALSDGDEGFNVSADVEIGETDEGDVEEDGEAFKVVNNFDTDIDVTVDLEDLDGDGDLTFVMTDDDETTEVEDGDDATVELSDGEELLVAIEVETDPGQDPEDIEGDVTFSAEPADD